MNKSCESCFARKIPDDIKDEIFIVFVGNKIECPLDDDKVSCIYSKMNLNWDYLLSLARNKRRGKDRKGSC
jgi:hypothetical protein